MVRCGKANGRGWVRFCVVWWGMVRNGVANGRGKFWLGKVGLGTARRGQVWFG